MSDVMEINVETGEVTYRDFTKKELAQREKDRIQAEKTALELKKKHEEEVIKRNAIVQKFLAIGLTEEEAEKIVPQIPVDDRIIHLL